MDSAKMKRYDKLNQIAEPKGIVIFGEDEDIPVGELRQAFSIRQKLYDRSFDALSVKDAVALFDAWVAPLAPETVLLHIGRSDLTFFKESPAGFDDRYCQLIAHIRTLDKKCRIVVVSLRNHDNDPLIAELNDHLRRIAASEGCEYGDIAGKEAGDPKLTRDAVSFVYSIGFVHPLKNERPVEDLVKMLFCWGL